MKKLFEIEYPEPKSPLINADNLDCCLKSRIHLQDGYREGVTVREVTFAMLDAEAEEADAEWAASVLAEQEEKDAEDGRMADEADWADEELAEAEEREYEFDFLGLELNVKAIALPKLKQCVLDILSEIDEIEGDDERLAAIEEWKIRLD